MLGRKNIGIDLGTTSTRIFIDGKGVVINEKSVIAVDRNTNKVLKLGHEAYNMIGRAPEDVEIIRPLRGGVVNRYEPTSYMIQQYIKRACGGFVMNPRVMICVPSNTSDVEQRAVKDSAFHAGAREIYLIEEPLAAAFGAGVPINSSKGKMIVDIGGGTTDIAVIVNGHVVISESIKIAGDRFNDDIKRYVREKLGLVIGEKTAENIKKNIGWAINHKNPVEYIAKGRAVDTGLPAAVKVTSLDTVRALSPSLLYIIKVIGDVIFRLPPELNSDVLDRNTSGIILTGGGSLLRGFPELIRTMTNTNAALAKEPELCVVKGTGIALQKLEYFKDDIADSKMR